MKIHIIEKQDRCREIWEALWPAKGVFDLWPVRESFHRAFQRPLHFVVAEEGGRVAGILPLCWSDESKAYVMFPGETWKGKTWIEQNRLIARDPEVLSRLIEAVSGPLHLRYLRPSPMYQDRLTLDEIGYLFYPGLFDFDMGAYWESFSGKSRKKIKRSLETLQGVSFRIDQTQDLDTLFTMNLKAFGENSYFSDPRFLNAFENLAHTLDTMGMLRVITLLVDGEVAAVDMGACFNNRCTLLAGGTHEGFPGVAKHINLFHMTWACERRMDALDFLCGDFNWKERFHLVQRPLYLFETPLHHIGSASNEELDRELIFA